MDFTITDRKIHSDQAKVVDTGTTENGGTKKWKLEALRKDMVAAMKAKDKVTKEAVSALIAAVKKSCH